MNSVFTSKFVLTIKTLGEDELKAFENWLRSPWCNSNKNLIRLFEQLKKYYPQFDTNKLTKEKLFRKVLPNGKFSVRRMNNLLSEGYLTAERFLIFHNLSQDQNLQKSLLTQEQQSRNLEDWFFRDADKEINRLEKKAVKDWDEHVDLLRMLRRVYHHPTQNPRMETGPALINKMNEQVDLVYLLEKATIINEKIFRNRILKNENHNVEAELKKWYTVSEGVDHPVLGFYRRRFAYQEAEMLDQFLSLRADFFERFRELNEMEQKVQLLSLMNDGFYLRKKGQLQFSELLSFYKFGFQHQLLLHNGIMTRITFTTAVAISNTSEEFEFTEKIIHNYSSSLSPNIRQDAIKWATAHTYSKKTQFDKCLETLLSHDFRAIYFRKVTRVLTLQTYFELFLKAPDSYQEYLLSYCNAFEKWIQREKHLSKLNKESYNRFIQKTRALVKIYSDIEFREKDLENLLLNVKNIDAGEWLRLKQKQIAELRQK